MKNSFSSLIGLLECPSLTFNIGFYSYQLRNYDLSCSPVYRPICFTHDVCGPTLELLIRLLRDFWRHFGLCRAAATDLYKYSPDAVPPIHAESYHVATDKPPAKDGDKFRSIFSDNLQPIATCRMKARGTLLVSQHCGNGCSIKRAPLSVSYYNEISGGHIGRGGYSEEGLCRPSTAPVVWVDLAGVASPVEDGWYPLW